MNPFRFWVFFFLFWSKSVHWHTYILQHQPWMRWAVVLSDLGLCQCTGQPSTRLAKNRPWFLWCTCGWWGFKRQLRSGCQIPSCRRTVHVMFTTYLCFLKAGHYLMNKQKQPRYLPWHMEAPFPQQWWTVFFSKHWSVPWSMWKWKGPMSLGAGSDQEALLLKPSIIFLLL